VSSGLSLPSSGKGSGDLSLTCKLAGISLTDTLLYVPDLPLMALKVSIDRFIEEVAPIPIESSRKWHRAFLSYPSQSGS
jgi:hypothetical protein